MKVIIISNSDFYVEELCRSAQLMNIEIISICKNIQQLNDVLSNNYYIDFLIGSDILLNDDINDLILYLKNKNLLEQTYFVLRNHNNGKYLNVNDCSFVFEEQVTPVELISRIKDDFDTETMTSNDETNTNAVNTMNNIVNNNQFTQSSNQNYNKLFMNEQSNQPKNNPSNNLNNQFNQQAENYNYNSNYKQEKTIYNDRFNTTNNFKSIMVAINSSKGGVGKTSLAIELAFLLASRAKEIDFNPVSKLQSSKQVKVCLVDLNPSFDTMASIIECVRTKDNYPTVAEWSGKIEEKIYNSLSSDEKDKLKEDKNHDFGPYLKQAKINFTFEEVESLLVKDETTGLYVLPSISYPFDVDYVRGEYINIILNQLNKLFDVVIIDTGNNISYFTVEALNMADEVLLVTTQTSASSVVLGKLLKTFDKLGVDMEKVNLVINNANGQKTDLEANVIAKVLNIPLVSVIPFDENLKIAHEKGKPYAVYNRKTLYGREMTKLAQQICPLWSVATRRKKSSSGFFKKIFKN